MTNCKIALKLFKKKIVCGTSCPIFKNCPRLILEDACDDATEKAILAMMEVNVEQNGHD
jgi:hypothetical protein